MNFKVTPAVKFLLGGCLGGFIAQATLDLYFGGNVKALFGLVPRLVVEKGYVWQILTYTFMHGDVSHLVFNMVALVFLGSELEALWGVRRFVSFSAVCAMFGAAAYILIAAFFPTVMDVPLVGISAAIYGMLVAYGVLFGERQMYFMMMLPMRARTFALLLGGVMLMTVLFSPDGRLSALAHLAGMVGGVFYLVTETRIRIRAREKDAKRIVSKLKPNRLRLVPKSEETKSDDKPPTWH